MKVAPLLVTCLSIVFIGTQPISAGSCPQDEIKKAVTYAADLVKSKGKAAFPELEKFRFCGNEGYIFVNDFNGVIQFHPTIKTLIGKSNVTDLDANGKYFAAEMLAKAKSPGEGWVAYVYLNPATKSLGNKCTFVKATTLDGKPAFVAGGVYGVNAQDCK